jgi:hypothetical protein
MGDCMSDIIKTMIDYVPTQIFEIVGCEKENAIEYIDQLKAKATELDLREKGVIVRESFDGFTCGRCNTMEEYCFNYCPNCGYKLNR